MNKGVVETLFFFYLSCFFVLSEFDVIEISGVYFTSVIVLVFWSYLLILAVY